MLRNDRLRVGDKHWNCKDLTEKLLKQIIKENVVLWKLKINFTSYSFFQPSPWGRGWDGLAFEYVIFHIDLLSNKAMFAGWNLTGTEAT